MILTHCRHCHYLTLKIKVICERLNILDQFSYYLIKMITTSSSEYSDIQWITWFTELPGNEFFCEIDEEFIRSDFNLYNLERKKTARLVFWGIPNLKGELVFLGWRRKYSTQCMSSLCRSHRPPDGGAAVISAQPPLMMQQQQAYTTSPSFIFYIPISLF